MAFFKTISYACALRRSPNNPSKAGANKNSAAGTGTALGIAL